MNDPIKNLSGQEIENLIELYRLERCLWDSSDADYYAIKALSSHRRPSSVCPSDVAYMGSNSKTKRPRKTKLCTGVPQITCDSHTDFKIKMSKVKVGRGHNVAAT